MLNWVYQTHKCVDELNKLKIHTLSDLMIIVMSMWSLMKLQASETYLRHFLPLHWGEKYKG